MVEVYGGGWLRSCFSIWFWINYAAEKSFIIRFYLNSAAGLYASSVRHVSTWRAFLILVPPTVNSACVVTHNIVSTSLSTSVDPQVGHLNGLMSFVHCEWQWLHMNQTHEQNLIICIPYPVLNLIRLREVVNKIWGVKTPRVFSPLSFWVKKERN